MRADRARRASRAALSASSYSHSVPVTGTRPSMPRYSRSGSFLRQPRAEPRPQDQHDDVERARRLDGVLEMAGGQHRLVLPPVALDGEEPAVILSELVDDELGAQPFVRDIARRRYENSQALRHGKVSRIRGGRATPSGTTPVRCGKSRPGLPHSVGAPFTYRSRACAVAFRRQ